MNTPTPLAAMATPVAVTAVTAVIAVVVSGLARRWRQARLTRHAHLVTIVPPPEVDPVGAALWWTHLAELLRPVWWRRLVCGTPHVALEYRWAGRRLTIALWVPGNVPTSPIAAAVTSSWPASTATVDPDDPPLPEAGGHAVAAGGALLPCLPGWYPLRTGHDADPLRPLVFAASGLGDDEHACLQVLARPATPWQIRRLRQGVGALRAGTTPTTWSDPARLLSALLSAALPGPAAGVPARGGPAATGLLAHHPDRDRDIRAAVDKLTDGPLWQVAVRYAIVHTNPRRLPADRLRPRITTRAHALASASAPLANNRQRLRRLPLPHPVDVLRARSMGGGFPLSSVEMAGLAGLPLDPAVPGLDRARAKPMPAPVGLPTGGRGVKILGRAAVGGHSVGLTVADARHHLHVVGSTGVGKSTLLTHLILGDVRAGRGVVVIDPKGDLVVDVLDRLPASVAPRVVLIDPDQERGARLNPLLGADPDLAVDNIVSVFAKIFQRFWGPRMDDVFRMACLTLLRHPNPVITNIPSLLQSKQFRARLTVGLDDPEGLQGFWEWFETAPGTLRSQTIAPVLARLRLILTRPFPKYTLGAARSSLDPQHILDHGGILLARLPKGQLGEDTARVMGSFVLSTIWQAATTRARRPADRRPDAAVYVDEAHNFLTLPGSVDDMLAEARGYHLSLTLAHQNLSQLPADTQHAISANARNKILFDVAPEDATDLAKHTLPELDAHDLSHPAAHHAAVRLVNANQTTPAFTLRTLPPPPVLGHADAIRQAQALRDTPTEPKDETPITTQKAS